MRAHKTMRFSTTIALFICCVASAAAAEGLSGLLPETVPPRLSGEAVEALPDGDREAFYDALAKLYTADAVPTADQKQALASLVTVVGASGGETPVDRQNAAALRSATARRVAVLRAALAVLTGEASGDEVTTAAENAIDSLTSLREDLAGIENGKAWLPYIVADDLAEVLTALAVGSREIDAAVIDTSLTRLSVETTTNTAQRRFFSRPKFRDLAASLTSLRDTLSTAPPPAAAVPADEPTRQAVGTVLAAVETLEREGGTENVAALLAAVDKADGAAAGFADYVAAVYLSGPSVAFDASEGFLDAVFRRRQSSTGPVTDFFNGSRIRGTSTTTSTTGIDLVEADGGAAFAITLSGTSRSQTTASSSRATIGTAGTHTFRGRYDVRFEDGRFVPGSSNVTVTPNLRTTSIGTSVGGLLSGVARRRAAEAVARSRSASLARARKRVSERVVPEFEDGVTEVIDDLNGGVDTDDGLRSRFTDAGITLGPLDATTTSDRLFAAITVGDPAPEPPLADITAADATLSIHERAAAAFADGFGLAGQTLTLDEARDVVRAKLEELLDRELPEREEDESAEPEDDENVSLIFAGEHPVAFEFEPGVIELVLRVGLKREGKDDVPPQTVRVPFTVEVDGDEFVLTPGTVIVAPYGEVVSRARQLGRSAAIRKRFAARLEPVRFSREVAVGEDGPATVFVEELFLADGWAVASLTAKSSLSGTTGTPRGRTVRTRRVR
ncbi:MAG: hypothetical protein AAF532_03365 [Planctomycetota bacterium]